MAYLKCDELLKYGFKSIGNNVLISDKCSIYNPQNISIGNNVRIDDFCVLSASNEIIFGDYIHIGCYSSFIGKGKIILENFVSISGRVSIYSSSDDYLGLGMNNPTVPEEFTNVTTADILIKKHAIVGAGSVITPGVTLAEGSAISALSLVLKNCEAFTIYRGVPAVKIGKRLDRFLEYENKIIL